MYVIHIALAREQWLREPDIPCAPIKFNFMDISFMRLLVVSYMFSNADASHIKCD